jgi:hypothetical protein
MTSSPIIGADIFQAALPDMDGWLRQGLFCEGLETS